MTTEDRWPLNRFRSTLPNALDSMRVAQAFVRACAHPMGFSEAELTTLEMVTEESVLNILQHAYERDELQSFTLECVRYPDQLELTFRDQGRPFDPGILPDYRGVDPEALTAPAGLGRYLVTRLVDRVEMRNLGSGGKEVHLFKRIHGDWKPPAEPPGFRESVQSLSNEDFGKVEIRRMRPEEAVEVSRLIYDAYRYTYMTETPYMPDKLRLQNEDGMLQCFVAVTQNGIVASHIAIIRSKETPLIAEVGLAVTLPESRGHGLAQRVGLLALQSAGTLGLLGVYGNFVTAHTASQKVAYRQGIGKPTGFFLARSPAGVSFKGIAEETPQRNSTIIVFQTLFERPRQVVFAPPKHAEIIRETYTKCELEVELGGDYPLELPAVASEIEVSVEKDRDLAKFQILTAGNDLAKKMKQRLFSLRLAKVPVAFAMLNLFSPETPAVSSELEKLGFFFSGILPGGLPNADALILTCLLSCALDYDKILVLGEEAQALLDYVKTQDPNYQPATA